jgi:two-component system sensor histidine kinase MprB
MPRGCDSTDREPCAVAGVPEQLARVIDNILDNAGHHGPSGGFVDVRRLAAALEVRDHGAGIGEDELPLVFDRFYRGASARERHGKGLGLVSVRHVVEGPPEGR